jgi:hypothetical protein
VSAPPSGSLIFIHQNILRKRPGFRPGFFLFWLYADPSRSTTPKDNSGIAPILFLVLANLHTGWEAW